jgi:hypothetical protein
MLKSGWNMKKIFCCPALDLSHCLSLWKTVLIVSSRAFWLSTPTFSLSTPVDNSEATWKKATKCNKSACAFVWHSVLSSRQFHLAIIYTEVHSGPGLISFMQNPLRASMINLSFYHYPLWASIPNSFCLLSYKCKICFSLVQQSHMFLFTIL